MVGKNVRYRNFDRKQQETGMITSVEWVEDAYDVMIRFDKADSPFGAMSVFMTQLEILSDTAESILWRIENNV